MVCETIASLFVLADVYETFFIPGAQWLAAARACGGGEGQNDTTRSDGLGRRHVSQERLSRRK